MEGSVFDLRTPKLLEELSQGAVYNPIMALDGEGGTLREVAEVSIPEQGRSYTLHTTARALQVYNAYNTVSYTHLDVYKRQVRRCSARSADRDGSA